MHVARQYTDVYQYFLVKYGRDVGTRKFQEYLSKKGKKVKKTRPVFNKFNLTTRSRSAKNVSNNNNDNIMYNIIFKKRTRRRNLFIT